MQYVLGVQRFTNHGKQLKKQKSTYKLSTHHGLMEKHDGIYWLVKTVMHTCFQQVNTAIVLKFDDFSYMPHELVASPIHVTYVQDTTALEVDLYKYDVHLILLDATAFDLTAYSGKFLRSKFSQIRISEHFEKKCHGI